MFSRIEHVLKLVDAVILLEYPNLDMARRRIAEREGGYGKRPEDLADILSYVEPFQEMMKARGAWTVSCALSIEESVAAIEEILHE